MGDLLGILAVALVTSKGAHGIPGSAIVILAATLSAHPAIPAIGLVLVLSVGEVHRREAHRQQHEGRAARGAQSREHPDFDEHSLEEGGSR